MFMQIKAILITAPDKNWRDKVGHCRQYFKTGRIILSIQIRMALEQDDHKKSIGLFEINWYLFCLYSLLLLPICTS